MDYSTRLPPRKRLLAGMKTRDCASEDPRRTPFRFHSVDLAARVRALFESTFASAEDFFEASNSVVLAAQKAAAAARAGAAEKAEAAARAKAFARSVLETVASAGQGSGTGLQADKKKRVSVDDLYTKSGQFCTDDDSRPSRKPGKKNAVKMKRATADITAAASAADSAAKGNAERASTGSSPGVKESKTLPVKRQKSSPQRDRTSHCSDKAGPKPPLAADTAAKKVKAKKKKVLLSQFSTVGVCSAAGSHPPASEGEPGSKPSSTKTAVNENESWKRKKLKLSQFYHGEKKSTPMGAKNGAAAATSAL